MISRDDILLVGRTQKPYGIRGEIMVLFQKEAYAEIDTDFYFLEIEDDKMYDVNDDELEEKMALEFRIEELQNAIPEFDWVKGHSGQLLTKEEEDILDELFNTTHPIM